MSSETYFDTNDQTSYLFKESLSIPFTNPDKPWFQEPTGNIVNSIDFNDLWTDTVGIEDISRSPLDQNLQTLTESYSLLPQTGKYTSKKKVPGSLPIFIYEDLVLNVVETDASGGALLKYIYHEINYLQGVLDNKFNKEIILKKDGVKQEMLGLSSSSDTNLSKWFFDNKNGSVYVSNYDSTKPYSLTFYRYEGAKGYEGFVNVNNISGNINGNLNVGGDLILKDDIALKRIGNNFIYSISCGQYHTAILLNTGKVVTFGSNEFGQLGNGDGGYEIDGTPKKSNLPIDVTDNTDSGYNGENAISVSCGANHTAILLNTGKVVTFGRNNYGQLGIGSSSSDSFTSFPQKITEVSSYNGENAVSVSCGQDNTAILLNTGEVLTFGHNQYGQLGNGESGTENDGTPKKSNLPIAVTPNTDSGYNRTNAVSVSCGSYHTAILLNTGEVVTFGSNSSGQLGNGYLDDSKIPVQVSQTAGYNRTNAISVSCAHNYTAILLNSGEVVTFGANSSGQLGNGNNDTSKIPVKVSQTAGYDGTNAVGVVCTVTVTMIILNTGAVVGFGFNSIGQLGNGNNVSYNFPVKVSESAGYDGTNAVSVACSNTHSVILLDNGEVLTFGYNASGQLGDNTNDNHNKPVKINGNYTGAILGHYKILNNIVKGIKININTGSIIVSQILNDGTNILSNANHIDNFYSQYKSFFNIFPNNNSDNETIYEINFDDKKPLEIYSDESIKIKNKLDINNNIEIQKTVIGNKYLQSIAMSNTSTLVIKKNGEVVSFGTDKEGNLGIQTSDGSTSSSPTSVKIKNGYDGKNAISVATSSEHSAILLNTGKVLTFGHNKYGTLGNGDMTLGEINVPIEVVSGNGYNGTNAVSVDVGSRHTLILLDSGKVVSFGGNDYGMLGTPTESNWALMGSVPYISTPVAVTHHDGYNGTNAVMISAQNLSSVILLDSGKVLTFGRNGSGQLGNGDSGYIDSKEKISDIPVAVKTDSGSDYDGTNAIQISCGAKHSAILLNSGKVVTFGYNFYGQLGDGNNVDSSIPVDVSINAGYDGTNAIQVSCGEYHTAILLNTGKVVTFGYNEYGQLGDDDGGNGNFSSIPVEVKYYSNSLYNGENAVSVCCGQNHTAILLNTGTILTFGNNANFQLGYSGSTTYDEPNDIVSLNNSCAIFGCIKVTNENSNGFSMFTHPINNEPFLFPMEYNNPIDLFYNKINEDNFFKLLSITNENSDRSYSINNGIHGFSINVNENTNSGITETESFVITNAGNVGIGGILRLGDWSGRANYSNEIKGDSQGWLQFYANGDQKMWMKEENILITPTQLGGGAIRLSGKTEDKNWENGDIFGKIEFGAVKYLGGYSQFPAAIAASSETTQYTSSSLNHEVSGRLEFYTKDSTDNVSNDSANPTKKMVLTGKGDLALGTQDVKFNDIIADDAVLQYATTLAITNENSVSGQTGPGGQLWIGGYSSSSLGPGITIKNDRVPTSYGITVGPYADYPNTYDLGLIIGPRNSALGISVLRSLTINNLGHVGIGTSPGGTAFYVRGSGEFENSLTANGSNVTSDDRIKHNEKKITNALSTISKLEAVKYFKTKKLYDSSHNFILNSAGKPLDDSGNVLEDYRIETGFIAQDILKIDDLKYAVDGLIEQSGNLIIPPDKSLGLSYNDIFVYGIQGIKELHFQQEKNIVDISLNKIDIEMNKIELAEAKQKITTLENDIAILKTQNQNLLSRLEALEKSN